MRFSLQGHLSIFSSPLPHNPAYAAAVPGHRIRGAAERGAGPCDPCPPAACPPACHPAHLHVTLCGRAGLGRPPVCDAHGAAAGVRCPPLVRALGARTHTHSCTHTHTHTHKTYAPRHAHTHGAAAGVCHLIMGRPANKAHMQLRVYCL